MLAFYPSFLILCIATIGFAQYIRGETKEDLQRCEEEALSIVDRLVEIFSINEENSELKKSISPYKKNQIKEMGQDIINKKEEAKSCGLALYWAVFSLLLTGALVWSFLLIVNSILPQDIFHIQTSHVVKNAPPLEMVIEICKIISIKVLNKSELIISAYFFITLSICFLVFVVLADSVRLKREALKGLAELKRIETFFY